MKGPLTGIRAWLVQRFSALYLLAFLAYALAAFPMSTASWSYPAWRAWVSAPGPTIALLLFFVALLLHAWVGMRDVILDYVGPAPLRVVLLGALAAGEIAVAAWMAIVLLHA